MDKIKKLLKKLSAADRNELTAALELLVDNNLEGLDIKKLAGTNFWRVRVGKFRIIFKRTDADNVIYEVRRRDENTYKGL